MKNTSSRVIEVKMWRNKWIRHSQEREWISFGGWLDVGEEEGSQVTGLNWEDRSAIF